MTERDELVQKLKAQISDWNAQAARWEKRARKAQAGMKAEYERQLEAFRKRSEESSMDRK